MWLEFGCTKYVCKYNKILNWGDRDGRQRQRRAKFYEGPEQRTATSADLKGQ